jgi:hypothetical protein
METYAILVKMRKRFYPKDKDGDGHEFIPLYINEIDAARAAERSDFDSYEIVPISLPVFN